MSSSRRRRRSPLWPAPGAAAAPAEQQVAAVAAADELVSRLRALLPPAAAANDRAKASRARVLREAGVYIRRLHAELDGLAERLAQRLDQDDPSAAAGVDGADDAADELVRNLLM